MQLRPCKAVLFDLDGTLLDSAPDLGAAANMLRVQRGLEPLPQSAYRPFVGTGARGMLRIALQVMPEDADFEHLKETFFQAYERSMGQHSQRFAGVDELLAHLVQAGLAWGIVTNKSERFTLPIVQADAVLQTAGTVVAGDTTAHSKPHPAPLLAAAARLGLAASDCIYIGDDLRDMQAARAAGMQAVAAAYGYLGGTEDVSQWEPDSIIHSPLQLLEQLGIG